MSGLAAGIRLAMFGQRVCILERHYAPGGLNSYYRLGGRNYDVGLHALTNFVPRNEKHKPLARLLRQLRIGWDQLELAEQFGSAIAFPDVRLRFTNDPAFFESEIARCFPSQRDNFRRLISELLDYDQLQSPLHAASAREVLSRTISDPLLAEMLLCPTMFYGSPREDDFDWASFSILFRAIFLEGLARPRRGIRSLLKILLRRFKELGGDLRLRAGVASILCTNGSAVGVRLDDGSEISAHQIISSAGWNETRQLCDRAAPLSPWERAGVRVPAVSSISFVEAIATLDCQPRDLGFGDTIVFFNDRPCFEYRRPLEPVSFHCGIVCSPNNYEYSDANNVDPAEGTLRLTALANFDRWSALSHEDYQTAKQQTYEQLLASATRFVPDFRAHVVAHDTFTPKTIRHFTGHDAGAVYGAPKSITMQVRQFLIFPFAAPIKALSGSSVR